MPVFLAASGPVTLREMVQFRKAGRFENRTLGSLRTFSACNEAVANMSASEAKNLAVARLRANPNAVFRFVDGRKFSALQAVDEVARDTEVGKYFTKIQKRAAEIALEALDAGKIQF